MRKIIVSRYQEDISWTNNLKSVDAVEIYNKGDTIQVDSSKTTVKSVPNCGREGATYLDFIVNNYEDLPEHMWFSQGNPFEHSPDFINLIEAQDHYLKKPFQCMSFLFKPNYIPPNYLLVNNNSFDIGENKCSHYFVKEMQIVGHCHFYDHGTELILRSFEEKYKTRDSFAYLADRIGIARPRPITEFSYGACFYAARQSILRHPRWTYQRARDFLLETDVQGAFQGYILERFWPFLISGTSYETLTDCYRSFLESKRTIAVYCSNRKVLWVKNISAPFTVASSSTTIVMVSDDSGRITKLPSIDICCPDSASVRAESVQQAESLLGELYSLELKHGFT